MLIISGVGGGEGVCVGGGEAVCFFNTFILGDLDKIATFSKCRENPKIV